MKNKFKLSPVIIMLFVILSSFSAIAAGDEQQKPWEKAVSNFIDRYWDPLKFQWKDDPSENAGDIYGWYEETELAKIAQWELLFCATDLQVEMEGVDNSATTTEDAVYMTTITTTAVRSNTGLQPPESKYLYEASWFFKPLNYDSAYRIYLKQSDGTKFYLPPNSGERMKPVYAYAGDQDYVAFYSDVVYERIFLEYTENDKNVTYSGGKINEKSS